MVGGGEIMAGRRWWWQNYGWSSVVVGDEFKIMTVVGGHGSWRPNYGWSWTVVDGRTIQ